MKIFFTNFAFFLILIWSFSKLKQSIVERQYVVFNQEVEVEVVDLPLCGKSNLITVRYNEKDYSMSVNKNDCINGRYKIGYKFFTNYNSKVDKIYNGSFEGAYRWNFAFASMVLIVYLIYLVRNFIDFRKRVKRIK